MAAGYLEATCRHEELVDIRPAIQSDLVGAPAFSRNDTSGPCIFPLTRPLDQRFPAEIRAVRHPLSAAGGKLLVIAYSSIRCRIKYLEHGPSVIELLAL